MAWHEPYYIHTWESWGCWSFIQELLKERVQDLINQNPEFDFENESVKVKISGDGARMTLNTSFIILSFALLQNYSDLMSARGKLYNCHSEGFRKVWNTERIICWFFFRYKWSKFHKQNHNGKEITLEFFWGEIINSF